jgi:hypothetical protein
VRHDELTGPVNGYKQISLTFVSAQFGDVEMGISIRLAFELVAVQIQQSRYSMPPPSSGVANIASDVGWLVVRQTTIIHQQELMTPKSNNHRFLISAQNREVGVC